MEEVLQLLLSPFLYIDGNYQMMRTEEITFVGISARKNASHKYFFEFESLILIDDILTHV